MLFCLARKYVCNAVGSLLSTNRMVMDDGLARPTGSSSNSSVSAPTSIKFASASDRLTTAAVVAVSYGTMSSL